MKLNKSKGKGKVHPSPFSSSSSSSSSPSFSLSSNSTDPNSALSLLLPAAILTLISALSLQDREVLAYMITHSLKSSPVNPSATPILDENNNHRSKKSKSKKPQQAHHKSPSSDCDCFDCYTAYWFRWDSSPHRELIHQAIEAFEEHLATTEQPKKTGRARRREKESTAAVSEVAVVEGSPESGESPAESGVSPAAAEEVEVREKKEVEEEKTEMEEEEEDSGGHKEEEEQQQHKGLARKVLPDVIGLLNSRFWNLWGPNV